MTIEDSPLGELPTELKMMIMTNLCGKIPFVSLIVEFAATRSTIGASKEEYLSFIQWEPLYVEKTNDNYRIGYHTSMEDEESDDDESQLDIDEFLVRVDMEINNE